MTSYLNGSVLQKYYLFCVFNIVLFIIGFALPYVSCFIVADKSFYSILENFTNRYPTTISFCTKTSYTILSGWWSYPPKIEVHESLLEHNVQVKIVKKLITNSRIFLRPIRWNFEECQESTNHCKFYPQ